MRVARTSMAMLGVGLVGTLLISSGGAAGAGVAQTGLTPPVTAPPAVALQTAVEIVAGLDFTNYSHAYGPTEMFFQEATTSAAAPTGPTG